MPEAALRTQLGRQVSHWTTAAVNLGTLEDLASPGAWAALERQLGVVLRGNLAEALERLRRDALVLRTEWQRARTPEDLARVRRFLVAFRSRYLRTETLLDFYGDAVNTRTSADMCYALASCDRLARHSLAQALEPLGKPTPPVLTYIDKGLGASILKAGLRLWDGTTDSAVAAIKIVRHNLYRPTALIHETGHQFAHIADWNRELALALRARLARRSTESAALWSSWSSEIAADIFAFLHTGYASVAGLHDVLSGGSEFVFRFIPGDPHPISYLRVLLGAAMCRAYFGGGAWDELAEAWQETNPWQEAEPDVQEIVKQSLVLLPEIVEIGIDAPARCFNGEALSRYLPPARVQPETLQELERRIGPALYTSHQWLSVEPVRLLALCGYQASIDPVRAVEILRRQRDWMMRLGTLSQAA